MLDKNYENFVKCFSEIISYEKSLLQPCLENFLNCQNLSEAKNLLNCLKKTIQFVENSSGHLDEKQILINVTRNELDKRINSFIRNQRHKTNVLNTYEFAGGEQDSEFSCARVDAVYRPSFGKRHFKIREVTNVKGPQRNNDDHREVLPSSAVNERIENLSQHINIDNHRSCVEGPMGRDVYEKLRCLEERVMFLEGVSPELFSYYGGRCDEEEEEEEDDDT